MSIYNRRNFHQHTFCRFQRIPNDFWQTIQPHYISKSGSAYYFTDEGVYRFSNHWGRAANCKWRLEGEKRSSGRFEVGYAKWSQFYPDFPNEKLYWIGLDENQRTFHYFHKNCPEYNGQILRTAQQTQSILRKLRERIKNRALSQEELNSLLADTQLM